MLLHFVYAMTSDRDRVHTFLFGTQLTNITRHLRHRDVDLALTLGRGKVDFLPYVTYLVDAPVTGSVEFNDVHELAGADRPAIIANVAGVAVFGVEAVHRLGYYSGCGSLAAASRPTEKVRVGDSS